MEFHAISGNEAVRELKTNMQKGLSTTRARQLLERMGENQLAHKKKRGLLLHFLAQFKDFMVLILLAACAVSFLTAFIEKNGEFLDPVIILVIVVLNAIIGVVQERRAERSLEALKRMSAPAARVLRDGRKGSLPAAKLVQGDIIYVQTGDLVPADARLLEGSGLRVQESALTGEAVPVGKDASLLLPEDCAAADRKNMLFSSTNVVTGHGIAVVTQTGMHTQVGKIAHLLNEEEAPQTPLQIRLEKTGKLLGIVTLGICALIFALGLLRHTSLQNSFMLAISLAVAAIPEGLPAIVTVVLSLGVQRMAKSNAIVRHLPAVETLGAATVICSDKTGTLTQNKMTVTRLYAPDGRQAEGEGKTRLLSMAALCCNAAMSGKGKRRRAQGEPTENAIVSAADAVVDLDMLHKENPRLFEEPFSSERKKMSALVKGREGYLLAVKGAPDVLLSSCSSVFLAGTVRPLDENLRRAVAAQNDSMAAQALRVIAVAYRITRSAGDTAEKDLVFCGLIGMQDPPRPEVFAAVRTCREAGIRPVMITGDHAATACAIARQLGILGEDGLCLTGRELDAFSQMQLQQEIARCAVFARVTPEHKVRIVKALRARGEVVAMTGDGVNDSPALKAADIGCAMGKSGTEVAKSAADMVLTDDNFATIVAAVAQGRSIYDNIKKAVHFLLGCNIGEIITILAASLLALPAPLLPIQLLWVNLVTDSLPAMALGVERAEKDIMRRKPVTPGKSMFAGGVGLDILLEGIMIGSLALLAFLIGSGTSLVLGRTMCFAVMSLSELVHTINIRSVHSVFRLSPFSNKKLTVSILICVLMQVSVITLPFCGAVFGTMPLSAEQWLTVGGLSLTPLFLVEISKCLKNDFVGKKKKLRERKIYK